MARQCSFSIGGTPVRWQRPRTGTHPRTGRPIFFTDKDAEAGKRVIAQAARLAWRGEPVMGPVVLRVVAIFAIPPSWPAALKAEALQARVMHIADPDLDQLVKLAQDALSGICYFDDNQVCGYPNSAKRYGQPERTEVTLEVLDQTEAQKTPGQRRLEREVALHGVGPVLARKATGSNRSKTKRRGR